MKDVNLFMQSFQSMSAVNIAKLLSWNEMVYKRKVTFSVLPCTVPYLLTFAAYLVPDDLTQREK